MYVGSSEWCCVVGQSSGVVVLNGVARGTYSYRLCVVVGCTVWRVRISRVYVWRVWLTSGWRGEEDGERGTMCGWEGVWRGS